MAVARAGSTMSNELLPVLVAALPNRREVETLVEAALERMLVAVKVDESPQPGVKYALELTCPGLTRRVAVLAELAGEASDGEEMLSVRPLGTQGQVDLRAFLEERGKASAPEVDPYAGRLLGGGKYEIGSLISTGAAGRIYRARHLMLDRPIAIKVLHAELATDPTFTAHFNGEARAASRLDHPNICRVFDFGQDDDGLLYIVMELLEGPELCEVVEQEGPLPLARIVDYVSQICVALSLAHERGIVHRDVKGENILAIATEDDDGHPTRVMKVCDFGLAMSMDLSRGEQFGTFRGPCGTPAYMPPEQVRGEMLDARADVYACGVLLYLMATGRLPFDDEDPRIVLRRQLDAVPIPPATVNPKVDPRLEAIIQRAMSKDRLGRYQSARELRTALKGLRAPEAGQFRAEAAVTDVHASLLVREPQSQRLELAVSPVLALLQDPASGLPGAVQALASGVTRGGGEEEACGALRRVLAKREQLSFLRQSAAGPDLLVQDAANEPIALEVAAPGPATAFLSQALARAGVVMLTLREGVEDAEVAMVLARLRAPQVTSASLVHATIVTDDVRLGVHRSLPWPVDIAATRIAFLLMTPESPARARAMQAALRVLGTHPEARTLLESSDLIGAAAKTSAWEVACAVGAGLAQPVCTRLLAALAAELVVNPGAVPVDLVRMLARRLAQDRSLHSDELLRNLLSRSVLVPEDVPEDMRSERLADLCAAQIVESPARALASLEAAANEEAYARQMVVVQEAAGILVQQGRLVALAYILRMLAEHAKDPVHAFRAPIASKTLSMLQDKAFLERVALVLLRGPSASHDAAESVIRATGAAGASALCAARLRTGHDLDLGARKRFAVVLRMGGEHAASAIQAALKKAGPDSLDVFIVEDLLRALPEGVPEEVGAAVLPFTKHFAPAVRRAALGALTAVLGRKVRLTVLSFLEDQDEGVRLAALVGVQRIGDLDPAGAAAVEALLTQGSDEIRATAAVALQVANAAARPQAVAALTRVVAPKKMSRVFRLGSGDDEPSAMVVEAAARALLAIGGSEGRQVVESRAAKAQGELQRRLSALLS